MDAEFWVSVVAWIPSGIVICVFGWLHFLLWQDAKNRAASWNEEEKRQQRVKDLYPKTPPYEERMGVQYGTKQD